MKVVSTKLSNEEHETILEMASLLGMNTAEYVRKCVMADLCNGWETNVPNELKPQLEQMKETNQRRFCSPLAPRQSSTDGNSDSHFIIIRG